MVVVVKKKKLLTTPSNRCQACRTRKDSSVLTGQPLHKYAHWQNGEEEPIEGHSSDRVNPKLFSHKLIEAGSAPYNYHVGSSSDESSITSRGMLSGGYERVQFDE